MKSLAAKYNEGDKEALKLMKRFLDEMKATKEIHDKIKMSIFLSKVRVPVP